VRGSPVPDIGRPPDVRTLATGELERARRDLAAALALTRPGSPARLPIDTHIPVPHTSTGLDIEEVRGPLEDTRHMRMALDLLEERLSNAYTCDGLESELWALREKIDAAELARLRAIGHHEYLVIQPLAPAAAEPLITKAAQAVKTLDDLGLIIRLI
jgi:hypothetical protein